MEFVNVWNWEVSNLVTGAQLQKKRLEYGFTQERLSEIICRNCVEPASSNAISNWECGKKLPSLQHLKFLSRLYRCAIDEMVKSYDEDEVA